MPGKKQASTPDTNAGRSPGATRTSAPKVQAQPLRGESGPSASQEGEQPTDLLIRDNLVDLKQVVSRLRFVRSVNELTAISSMSLKEPWSTAVSPEGIKYLSLPQNYEELAKTSYLVTLALLCFEKLGYQGLVGNSSFQLRHTYSEADNVYLKALGIVVLNNEIPQLPKTKGLVFRGIATSANLILDGEKKLNLNLFKVKNQPSPILVVFGKTPGKDVATERKLLDFVVHYIRTLKTSDVKMDLSDLLLPMEAIRQQMGLDVCTDNQLIIPAERVFINRAAELLGHSLKWDAPKVPETLVGIQELQNVIEQRQRSLKNLKDTVRVLISDRVSTCFKPYQKKAERERAKKKSILELRDLVKGSDYYIPFNPTRVFEINNLHTRLSDEGIPHALITAQNSALVEARDSIVSNGMSLAVANAICDEYVSYSRIIRDALGLKP